ncbi:hypothetical protein HD806DRAFT_536271 [Xylariaceae sp. AK1471]|nr:hypothetical protein HD806DRAFT_536271 [Xylariaceae sp. AK1471]
MPKHTILVERHSRRRSDNSSTRPTEGRHDARHEHHRSARPLPHTGKLPILPNEVESAILAVLLRELCSVWNDNEAAFEIRPPERDFKLDVAEVLVKRGQDGAYQPVLDDRYEWGVKTSYDDYHHKYLATILIRIPYELTSVLDATIDAVFQYIFFKGLVGHRSLPEIPFLNNNHDYRHHGMLFQFEGSRDRKPQLFYADMMLDKEKREVEIAREQERAREREDRERNVRELGNENIGNEREQPGNERELGDENIGDEREMEDEKKGKERESATIIEGDETRLAKAKQARLEYGNRRWNSHEDHGIGEASYE